MSCGEKAPTGQLDGACGGPPGGHCCGYIGCPPPPRGPPGPTRPYLQHFSAGMPGGGPPGSGWKDGAGGGGSNGAALTSPTPLVSADMPTPATIAAAAATRLRLILSASPTSQRWLPVARAARRITTSLSCLCESLLVRSLQVKRICRWMRSVKDERGFSHEGPARRHRRSPSSWRCDAGGVDGFRTLTRQARGCPCTATPGTATG